MSDIRKLIDVLSEMATTSGSVATVASPMGGTQRRSKQSKDSIFYEGDAVCHTCHQHECQCDANSRKAPESPEVSNFGLWKNSILAGKEQKAKKKSKVKESVTDYNPPSQGGTRKELLAKLKAAKSKDEKSDLATRARKAGASQKELQAVSEGGGYQGQYASKDEAIAYAKEKVKKFRDPDDGIEIWAMPGGRFDVVHTMNSAGRNHVIDNGGKKLSTISARDRVDELGNSLMPGGQRALRLAQETFQDPRASRRHPGATDVAEGMLTHRDFEKPDDVDVLKMAKMAAKGLLTYAVKRKMNPANLLKKDYYALAEMLEKVNPQLYAAIDDQLSDNDYNWLYFKAAALAANAAAKQGMAEATGNPGMPRPYDQGQSDAKKGRPYDNPYDQPGEQQEHSQYKKGYEQSKNQGVAEDSLNEHGDPWEDPNYDPRGGGETRSPEQIEKDNAEHAILSKKLGLKNTNKLPDIKDDMLKMMNHFMYDERKKKK